MENKRNYYRVLHVQPDAPAEIIRASYRTLMQKLRMHPDLGGSEWNAVLMNQALSVLLDPKQRAAYDRELLARFSKPILSGGYEVGGKSRFDGSPGVAQPDANDAQGYTPVIKSYCPFCLTPCQPAEEQAKDSTCVGCGSPLSPAYLGGHPVSGRRSLERIDHQRPVIYFSDWPQKSARGGRILDLSLQGIRFVTREIVDVGAHLKMDCAVCKGIARVVRCLPMKDQMGPVWSVGAEFVTLRFDESCGSFISVTA